MSRRMDRGSMEHVLVAASKDDGDPGTSDTVQIAVVAEGTRPSSSDLKTATWESSTFTQGGKTYRYAKILVAGSSGAATGTQDLTLSPSSYPARFDVFIKVTDSPEVPMFKSGVLTVT